MFCSARVRLNTCKWQVLRAVMDKGELDTSPVLKCHSLNIFKENWRFMALVSFNLSYYLNLCFILSWILGLKQITINQCGKFYFHWENKICLMMWFLAIHYDKNIRVAFSTPGVGKIYASFSILSLEQIYLLITYLPGTGKIRKLSSFPS